MVKMNLDLKYNNNNNNLFVLVTYMQVIIVLVNHNVCDAFLVSYENRFERGVEAHPP